MNEFDKAYDDLMMRLEEGKFKSLATAGMLGLGALGGASDADAESHRQPTSEVQQISDSTILKIVTPQTIRFETSNQHRTHAHDDSMDNLVIGYGFLLEEPHVAKLISEYGYNIERLLDGSQGIRKSDSDKILPELLSIALKDAKKYVEDWDSVPIRVKVLLTDMSYQLGYNKLIGFEQMKIGIDSKDYRYATEELVDSKWYRQSGNRSKYWESIMDGVARKRGQ